jgi:membrane protein DedA with SNARE-associated domain
VAGDRRPRAGHRPRATILYGLSRWAGRDLVYRYGRYIRLSPPRLERAEGWIRGYGALAVVVGRLLPGLRIATAVACGVFGLPARQFLPAMAVGSLLYITAYTLLGYYFGRPVLDFVAGLDLSLGVVLSFGLLAVFLVWIVRAQVVVRAGGAGGTPLLSPMRRRRTRRCSSRCRLG